MIYTDKTHLVAENLDILHDFAKVIGLNRCWFEGTKKGHPHYDIPPGKKQQILSSPLVKIVSSREVLAISKKSLKSL